VDTCDESARRCVHTNSSGGSCNDGNSCTTSDQCQDGTCKGLPVICPDDGNKCTTAVCDPSGPSPVCNHLPSVLCRPDGNPCTEDNCNPLTGACHTPLPDGSACDDHIDCTQGDACLAGVCTGTPAPCPDDGNVCTDDLCDGQGACIHPGKSVDTPCQDDGNACTVDSCGGSPPTCQHIVLTSAPCTDDGNECTLDVCNGGQCTHEALPFGRDCTDDGDACTVDMCANGLCRHTPVHGSPCPDDGNSCTLDV